MFIDLPQADVNTAIYETVEEATNTNIAQESVNQAYERANISLPYAVFSDTYKEMRSEVRTQTYSKIQNFIAAIERAQTNPEDYRDVKIGLNLAYALFFGTPLELKESMLSLVDYLSHDNDIRIEALNLHALSLLDWQSLQVATKACAKAIADTPNPYYMRDCDDQDDLNFALKLDILIRGFVTFGICQQELDIARVYNETDGDISRLNEEKEEFLQSLSSLLNESLNEFGATYDKSLEMLFMPTSGMATIVDTFTVDDPAFDRFLEQYAEIKSELCRKTTEKCRTVADSSDSEELKLAMDGITFVVDCLFSDPTKLDLSYIHCEEFNHPLLTEKELREVCFVPKMIIKALYFGNRDALSHFTEAITGVYYHFSEEDQKLLKAFYTLSALREKADLYQLYFELEGNVDALEEMSQTLFDTLALGINSFVLLSELEETDVWMDGEGEIHYLDD